MNWQLIIAIVLLAVAIFYIIKSMRKSAEGECGDCEVGQIVQKQKNKK